MELLWRVDLTFFRSEDTSIVSELLHNALDYLPSGSMLSVHHDGSCVEFMIAIKADSSLEALWKAVQAVRQAWRLGLKLSLDGLYMSEARAQRYEAWLEEHDPEGQIRDWVQETFGEDYNAP